MIEPQKTLRVQRASFVGKAGGVDRGGEISSLALGRGGRRALSKKGCAPVHKTSLSRRSEKKGTRLFAREAPATKQGNSRPPTILALTRQSFVKKRG